MCAGSRREESLITAGNGGTKPTQAAFTIFYNQGTQRYDLERTLQPDEQMWIDVGKLIREQVPDKNGKPLPSDLTMGSYEFRDLTNTGIGTLFEGKVIYDKTYGHVTYGCGSCCGYKGTRVWYDPLGIPLLGASGDGVNALDTCSGLWEDVSADMYGNWSTANTSIATADYYGTHTGYSVGSTTSSTGGQLPKASLKTYCPLAYFGSGGGVNVNPVVTIGSFSQNPILQGGTATVTVTVNSSATISLAIAGSGTGAATFDTQGGGTTKTISGTTTVTIYGSAASTNSYDVTLSASYNGTTLASKVFSVTSGACTLGGEHDSGSGTKQCPSTVTLQSNYTVSQYCSTCSYTCVVHTDGAWTPTSACGTVIQDFAASLTGTETSSATGTFSAPDCNWHYAYFITTVTDAHGVRTNDPGLSIGLKCANYPNGNLCP